MTSQQRMPTTSHEARRKSRARNSQRQGLVNGTAGLLGAVLGASLGLDLEENLPLVAGISVFFVVCGVLVLLTRFHNPSQKAMALSILLNGGGAALGAVFSIWLIHTLNAGLIGIGFTAVGAAVVFWSVVRCARNESAEDYLARTEPYLAWAYQLDPPPTEEDAQELLKTAEKVGLKARSDIEENHRWRKG